MSLDRLFNLWQQLLVRSRPLEDYPRAQKMYHLLIIAHRVQEGNGHGTDYLERCLNRFSEARVQGRANNPDAVEYALWLHKIVCDPKRTDNAKRSAERGYRFCKEEILSSDLAQVVKDLILAANRQGDPATYSPDQQLIADIVSSAERQPEQQP